MEKETFYVLAFDAKLTDDEIEIWYDGVDCRDPDFVRHPEIAPAFLTRYKDMISFHSYNGHYGYYRNICDSDRMSTIRGSTIEELYSEIAAWASSEIANFPPDVYIMKVDRDVIPPKAVQYLNQTVTRV